VQTEAEQAESFKNEGNKFFKAGDYTHAIEFYTKGESTRGFQEFAQCRCCATVG
jgi:hypothetical protein